jgi:RNA polymerase sigma-70 factor (ECF subfamily)
VYIRTYAKIGQNSCDYRALGAQLKFACLVVSRNRLNMSDSSSFADLLAQLRAGDEAAARDLFQRFSARLIELARSRLDNWVRRREDPEDVVQSVYKSFFARVREGQFDLVNWNDLWSLLTTITLNKCADRIDHTRAQRRDASREVKAPAAAADPQPTPLEALVLTETVDELFRAFDPEDRPILQMSLQGYTVLEISGELNRAERTVRRVREQVKKRLQRMQAASGNP